MTSSQSAAERADRALADQMLRQMIFLGDPAVGARLLGQQPQLASVDVFTATATGRLDEVRGQLARDPAAAARPGGPLAWQPLLYLAYSRLPGHDAQAVEVARLLLDHGADPNAQWKDDWGSPFTVLAGVVGQGEGMKPMHPQANMLAVLLLERGAEPCDSQLLYNNSIAGDDTHWLELLWNASAARGETHKWTDKQPATGTGRHAVNQLDYLLGNAVTHRHIRRAAWLLEHGADADCTHVYTGRRLLELAQLHGLQQIDALLRTHGAAERPLDPPLAFQLACRKGDFNAARAIAAATPDMAQQSAPLAAAAAFDRVDLIDFLLELGTPVDIQDEGGVRALQQATMHDARQAVARLLARGAQVDTPTKHYGGAMGTAAHFGRRECAALLAPHSRDVHNMVSLGLRDRLADLLAAEPELVNLVHFRIGTTPLFWLPGEDAAALDMARFLLERGANPAARDRDGHTPEEVARLQGREALADLLAGGK